jgi:large-conductance mechanosensitive channel
MVLSMVAVGLGIAFAVGYAFDSILTKWGFWSYNKTECTMFGFTLDVISMLIGLVIGIAGCYTVSDLVYDIRNK